MFESQLIIDGRRVEMPAGMTYDRRNPVSDTVVTRAAAGRVNEALMAVDAAAAAFSDWSQSSPEKRSAILRRTSDIFADQADEVIGIAAEEIGSSEEWTRFNIDIARQILSQAATLTGEIREMRQSGQEREYLLRRRPAGVVLGIAPWNAAVTLATRAVAGPLACANTAVLKASELCPKTHEWVARAFCAAGLPPGVLNFITNAPERAEEVVDALIGHPAVRRVNFTGSTRVGREIAGIAARYLKPCILELSGKGTVLVLADADLDHAARCAFHGSFFNQGQICMSTERIVVVDEVADAFVEKIVALANDMPDTNGKTGPLGALIDPQALLRIRGLVEDAVEKGALLLAGGQLFDITMRPTILDRVSTGMRIYSEEAFGPVAAVIRVADAEEGLSIVNDTEFGLVASVFSADGDRALEIARQFETGIAHVNGSTVFDDPTMPFGGLKASGYGRIGGRSTLEAFTETQWITVRDGSAGRRNASESALQTVEEPK